MEDIRFRVLYPGGEISRLLTRREAEPLFQLYGVELLEMRGENPERKHEHELHSGVYAIDPKDTRCTCLEAVKARMNLGTTTLT